MKFLISPLKCFLCQVIILKLVYRKINYQPSIIFTKKIDLIQITNIVIQMNQKELTNTFMMISKWKNPLVSMDTKGFFHFEIIINVFVSSFWFIWITMFVNSMKNVTKHIKIKFLISPLKFFFCQVIILKLVHRKINYQPSIIFTKKIDLIQICGIWKSAPFCLQSNFLRCLILIQPP